MAEETTNTEQSRAAADCQNERLVMLHGYCCDCEHNPAESVVQASKIPGHPCNGCWFNDDKSNWKSKDGKQYYTDDGTLMNANGSRSIFDDIDA